MPVAVRIGPPPNRAKPVLPLPPKDLRLASDVAERVRGEIAALAERLGDAGASPRALARATDADFALCQRVLAAIRTSSPVDVLTKLPGVEGVRSVVRGMLAAAGRSGSGAARHPAMRAVESFESLVEGFGSHAQLVRRLRASITDPATPASDSEEPRGLAARAQMFHSNTAYVAASVNLTLLIVAVRPIPGQPGKIEGVHASGVVGLIGDDAGEGGRLSHVSRSQHRDRAGHAAVQVNVEPLGERIGEGSDGLVTEFSTRPLPIIASEQRGGSARTVFDITQTGRAGVDLLVGRRWWPDEDPRVSPDRRWTQMVRIKRPSRRLLVDVYLHRSLAAGCIPETGAALSHPGLSPDLSHEWDRRLPGRVRLEMLGAGLGGAPSAAWPKHAPLTSWLFDKAGWDSTEYVGFRIDEQFPVWGAAYVLSFVYPPAEDRGA